MVGHQTYIDKVSQLPANIQPSFPFPACTPQGIRAGQNELQDTGIDPIKK